MRCAAVDPKPGTLFERERLGKQQRRDVVRRLSWAVVIAVGSLSAGAVPCAVAAPDPVNGCRFAAPEEIAGPAGVTVTAELDRGASRCIYNNGEDASGAKTFVQVDPLNAADFDREVAKMAGNADVTDVPELGVESKRLIFQHQGVQSAVLMVKADAAHAFTVEIFPMADRANEVAVARLLMPRVQNG